MTGWVRIAAMTGGGGILLAGAVLAAALLIPADDRSPGHNPGHVNCPPGAHGRGWSRDHAKSFNVPRRQGWGRADLSERAFTASGRDGN